MVYGKSEFSFGQSIAIVLLVTSRPVAPSNFTYEPHDRRSKFLPQLLQFWLQLRFWNLPNLQLDILYVGSFRRAAILFSFVWVESRPSTSSVSRDIWFETYASSNPPKNKVRFLSVFLAISIPFFYLHGLRGIRGARLTGLDPSLHKVPLEADIIVWFTNCCTTICEPLLWGFFVFQRFHI